MKKITKMMCALFAAMVLLFSAPGQVFATTVSVGNQTELCNTPHSYEITASSSEWAEMSLSERLDACAVSAEEAQNMTTSALVETVINYPFLVNIYAFGSIGDGINIVGSYFPALTELLSREDVSLELGSHLKGIVSKAKTSNEYAFETLSLQDLLLYSNGQKELAFDSNILPRFSQVTDRTPNGTTITLLMDLTWADHDTTLNKEQIITYEYTQTYPSARILAAQSPSYNCHSYAFVLQDTSNRFWLNDPIDFISDGSYVQTTSNGQGGLKVVYFYQTLYRWHSAVTVLGGPRIIVKSKWGVNALFQHYVDDCPYAISSVIRYYERA